MAELVKAEKQAKTSEEEPSAAVIGNKKPRSAAFFVDHTLNALMLSLISAQYIATVYVLLKYPVSKWMSLGSIAMVTLMVGVMLYVILKFKYEHTEKYAMAPLAAQVAVADKAAAGSNV